MGFPGALLLKSPPANAVDSDSIPGQEGPMVKGLATPSSIISWEIPWREEPGGLQSLGLQSVKTKHMCKAESKSQHIHE